MFCSLKVDRFEPKTCDMRHAAKICKLKLMTSSVVQTDEAIMAAEEDKRICGKYCVAGGPGLISCTNTSLTEGVSMHLFPTNEVRRAKWERFVRKHRPGFKATQASTLCSVHFEQTCFHRLMNIGDPRQVRRLNNTAVPTIDVAVANPPKEPSERERRQLLRSAIAEASRDYEPCCSSILEADIPVANVDNPGDGDNGLEIVDENHAAAGQSANTPVISSNGAAMPISTAVTTPNSEPPLQLIAHAGQSANTLISSSDITLTQSMSTPVTTSIVGSVTPSDCSRCAELKNSIRKGQKQISRLKRVNAKLQTELKSMYDTTASSGSEDGGDSEDSEDADDDVDDAALEEEVKECLRDWEEEECNAPKMKTGDEDWGSGSYETEPSTADDDEDSVGRNDEKVGVEPQTKVEDEPKFIVFYSMLLSLFSMFCFLCRKGKPKVTVTRSGTMAVLTQSCKECGRSYQWRSQPFVLGRYPAGNILLSFGILMAGASVSRVLLALRHMGLAVFSIRTYFLHQKKFLFPVVLHYWEDYRLKLLNQLKSIQGTVFSGDGRFDSMGHSAKYGTYTMFSCDLMKIVHFDLLQANQTGSSQAMELQGAKNCFDFLRRTGVAIAVFISDRHRGIAKWIRESQSGTSHYYDIWHVARSIAKKLLKASKEKGCEAIKDWIKGVRNHLYWCTTSTSQGFQEMITAKWWSFMRHVANKHKDHPNSLFKQCTHDMIEPRKWIKIGSKAYEKITGILTNTQILNDIKKLSHDAQTSCLEGYHATLNFWHPKMVYFSWIGTFCRHVLASLHFNENLKRTTKTSEDGRPYIHVTYPKFKNGEEVVREIGVPPTYGYVSEIKKLLFSLPLPTLSRIMVQYKDKIPEPLNRQFPERLDRDKAIKRQHGRKRTRTELFPSAEDQESLQNEQATAAPPNKKGRTCATCGQSRRGHPRKGYPFVNDERYNSPSLIE